MFSFDNLKNPKLYLARKDFAFHFLAIFPPNNLKLKIESSWLASYEASNHNNRPTIVRKNHCTSTRHFEELTREFLLS